MKTFRTYNQLIEACLAYVTTEKQVYYKGREFVYSSAYEYGEIKTENGWERMNRRKHKLRDFSFDK